MHPTDAPPRVDPSQQPTLDSPPGGTNDDWAEALPSGTVLGRYIVTERLGAGGAGIVYGAYDPELKRNVALKLLRADAGGSDAAAPLGAASMLGSASTSDAQARLMREAQAMAMVNHENVLPIYDVGVFYPRDVVGRQPFAERVGTARVVIVMELAKGGTLRSWRQTNKPSWRQALDVLMAAGRGLAAAHKAGLIHRDFKPDNVLLSTDDPVRVRVSDFGLGGDDMEAPPASEALDSTGKLTQHGAIMGTLGYMAPEQSAPEKRRAPVRVSQSDTQKLN